MEILRDNMTKPLNVLFVLYGDLSSNSATPLSLYASEFSKRGHSCAVAIPNNLESISHHSNPDFIPVLYSVALESPESIFPNGCPADIVHAWTPRENVRRFVTAYMAQHPAPLVIYLEDHELWISTRALGLEGSTLQHQTEEGIAERLPDALSHPFRYDSFIGLADAAVIIQKKLIVDIPSWLDCTVVMPGIDLEFFSPRVVDAELRKRYGVAESEKVIVYPGGLNGFTKPAIQTLCKAIGLINEKGYPCRLLRTGPFALDFLEELPQVTANAIVDFGVIPRNDLPDLLALADVFVQPGKIDPFEDLRLPGKLPELLAMGRPVVMPDTNISHMLSNEVNIVLTRTGSAEEIAEKCICLFEDALRADEIGRAGRLFAERNFDINSQASILLGVYGVARRNFNSSLAAKVWQNHGDGDAVEQLLAKKLKLMAEKNVNPVRVEIAALLKDYTRLMQSKISRVNGLEAELAARIKEVHDKEFYILECGGQVDGLNNDLDEIHKSNWWMRSPARFVGRQLRRIKVIFRAWPYALAMCGGYRGLIKHAYAVYKYEGVSGIRRRVSFSAAPGSPLPAHKSKGNDYDKWVRRYDTLTVHGRNKIKNRIRNLPPSPLVSIVMPVYNPPLQMLEDAIQSVQAQLYPNWELCIADDASTDAAVAELLQRYADSDPRIKVVFRKENGHISAASNSALALVNGEFVALLDNDDLLREHALFWVVDALIAHPEAGVIYSDEDKIDESGRRYGPYFKSDWNPDLFLSHNMICHFGVYRTALVRELGGFREGYEGAQDYDLALRCTEQLAAPQIVHIPRVLYHWRSHSGSTAHAGSEKNYALLAGQRALDDHFTRCNISAQAELLDFGMYRARYNIPAPAPVVSLIIPTRNGLKLLKQCIESILTKTTYKNYEILIVDNNSDDPKILDYFKELRKNKKIRVLRDERPFNYSALNNVAVQQAHGEYIGLVNNDIEVSSPGWLDEMMGLASQPGVGAVGARLWYPNNTLQHGGIILGLGGLAGHAHKHLHKGAPGYFSRAQLIQSLSAVTAACLIIKKSIFNEVGGLDEVNLKIAFNDVDFCLRVREAGYRNIWTPYAELYHHESATRGNEDTSEKQMRFSEEVRYMKKCWGDLLINDPAYNPNLTLGREDFSYAWPPRVND